MARRGAARTGENGRPAAAAGAEVDAGDLTRVFRLPSIWRELGRFVARHWALPVFVLSVVLGLWVWVLFPDPTLVRRSAEEYFRRARAARAVALEAKRDGRLSDAITRFDTVVHNLETLGSLYGFTLESAKGEKRREAPYWLGEAYLELAALQEADPGGVGSRVRVPRGELLRRGALRLREAAYFRDKLDRRAEAARVAYERAAREYPVDPKELARLDRALARREALRFGEAEAQRIDLLRSEALVGVGRPAQAIRILESLLERIRSVEIEGLRQERAVEPAAAGAVEPGAGLGPQDRARIHLVLGEARETLGHAAEALAEYERFLDEGGRGPGAHRARAHLIRLGSEAGVRALRAAAEPGSPEAEAQRAAAQRHFEDTREFSLQLARSDAPRPLRDEGVFTAARMELRLGRLAAEEADRLAARIRTAEAAQRRAEARDWYGRAELRLRHAFAPQSGYQEQAQILVGRVLLALGRHDEAQELFELIRGTATRPEFTFVARVSLADASLARSRWDEAWEGPAETAGESGTLGYRALGQWPDLWRGASRMGLAPEIVELMHPAYLVGLPHAAGAPELAVPDEALPENRGRLMLLARHWHQMGRFERAAEVYAHIRDTYAAAPGPGGSGGYMERDRCLWLVAREYAEVARALAAQGAAPAEFEGLVEVSPEAARAHLRAARAYVRLPRETPASVLVSEAYWRAALEYERAGVSEGVVLALEQFTERCGGDARDSRARHMLGAALARIGRYDEAAACHAGNAAGCADSYAYQSDVAHAETLLAAGHVPRARETFLAVLRDARYTPESHIWMRAAFGLVEASWLAACELDAAAHLAEADATRLEAEGKADQAEAERARAYASREGAARLYEEVADRLAEARERFPLERVRAERSPYFLPFLERAWLPSAHRGALALLALGRLASARRYLEEVIGEGERGQALRRSAFVYLGLSYLEEDPPRLEDAMRVFREGIEAYPRTEEAALMSMLLGIAAERSGEEAGKVEEHHAHAELGLSELPGEEAPGAPKRFGPALWRAQNDWFRKDLGRRAGP